MGLVDCAPDRRISAAVFGNRHRLELLVALADAGDEGVNLSQLALAQGVSTSVYYGPIRGLISAGLVDRLGRVSGDRRCWYRRRGGRFWECMPSLVSDLAKVEGKAS